jgi:hypothetical protein
VPGVPGNGAKLNIDMVGTVGSFGQGLLPTGNVGTFSISRLRKAGGHAHGRRQPLLLYQGEGHRPARRRGQEDRP